MRSAIRRMMRVRSTTSRSSSASSTTCCTARDRTGFGCHRGHVRFSRPRVRAGTARSTSDRTGRTCWRRLLLGHSVEVRARCPPARSTNRLQGSLAAPVIIGVRPGGRTPPFNIPVTTEWSLRLRSSAGVVRASGSVALARGKLFKPSPWPARSWQPADPQNKPQVLGPFRRPARFVHGLRGPWGGEARDGSRVPAGP